MIGLSDGGAHVDLLCDVGYATALLEIWVRQRQVLSLENAVRKLTSVHTAKASDRMKNADRTAPAQEIPRPSTE
jgi:N-acyl-D-aspartate/D-glutamate deacylase